jgi:hypothetical protein
VIFFSLSASSGEHTNCENDKDEESEVFFVFFFSFVVLFPLAALVVVLNRRRMICFLSLFSEAKDLKISLSHQSAQKRLSK